MKLSKHDGLYGAAKILCGIDTTNGVDDVVTLESARLLLEDTQSPVTKRFQEELYRSLINKAHVSFGDIPASKGDITRYSGYDPMIKTLDAIEDLAQEKGVQQENNKEVIDYVNIVKTAIKNIAELSSSYSKGFTNRATLVAIEYNTYVYTCVQATTALLYTYLDYIKTPNSEVMEIKLKNTTLRADAFYFEQLAKFNAAQSKMGIEYRKYLEQLASKSKEGFLGIEAIVGITAIAVAALSIVPITRELIYQIFRLRTSLSDMLELQSKFLDMNRLALENNSTLPEKKRAKVIERQKGLVKILHKLSDKIRVNSSQSIEQSKRDLAKDNKNVNIDKIRDDVANSPFEII
jgi:hypothetical protein